MNAETFLNDIPRDVAHAAYSGVSFTPEKRADQEREGYAATLAADYESLAKCVEAKPSMAPVLESEFARYREGYRQRLLKKLHSDSRCMSWMITGPSNFPVRRMEKRNAVAAKRLNELVEFRERALSAIRKTLCPELRPIMAGDGDACERLGEKIAEAEQLQERMTEANKVIRKFKNDPHNGCLALEARGFTAGQAQRLFQPDFCGRIGFPDYQTKNNAANIRRMKQRLEGISRNQAIEATEAQGDKATFADCPAENRVRLFFPGKPDEATRSRLKSAGFRWSPTIGAWQAYRNYNAIETAKREAGLAAIPNETAKAA